MVRRVMPCSVHQVERTLNTLGCPENVLPRATSPVDQRSFASSPRSSQLFCPSEDALHLRRL